MVHTGLCESHAGGKGSTATEEEGVFVLVVMVNYPARSMLDDSALD
jgi:hypothetical protein